MELPFRRDDHAGVTDATGALVIASHLPGEGHFHSERFEVIGWECVGDFGYWEGLAAVWESDRPLVLVEHDIDVSDEHIAALLECPHPLCSWAYRCHWISGGLMFDLFAVGSRRGSHFHGGEEWADWSAIGLVKLTAEARTGPLRREPWGRVELAVEAAVMRPWHVHWPEVQHHHW